MQKSAMEPEPTFDADADARKTRLFASGATLAALIIFSFAALIGENTITALAGSRTWVTHTYDVLRSLEGLLVTMEEAESGQRGYLITGVQSYLSEEQRAAASVGPRLHGLENLVLDNPAQSRRAATLGAIANRRLGAITRAVEIRRGEGEEAAARFVAEGPGKPLMDSVRTIAAEMKSREERLLANRTLQERRSLQRAKVVGGTAVAIAAILALLAVLLTSRTLRVLAAMRRSAKYVRSLIDSTSDGLYGLDATGSITFVNKAMADLLGYSTGDLVGRDAHSTIHHTREDGSPYPAADCPMYRVAGGGAGGTFTNEIIWTKDRQAIPVEYSVNPMVDGEGRPGAVVGFRDITEHIWAESALRRGVEEAKAASQAKSDFLARMSHELRTPLNSIIGFANVLRRNKAGNLRSEDLGFLERVHRNGVNLLTLINDILDLSKIEAGKMEADVIPVRLDEIVQRVVEEFEPQLIGKNVTLAAEVPDSVNPIRTDPGKLRQILLNLVGNAVKFTDAGTVTISIEADAAGTPLEIRVRDSGIGIPASRISAIFQPFEQAEESTSRHYGGTGLGLPISQSLAELLGFSLTVKSVEGQGSVFTLSLKPKQTVVAPGERTVMPSEQESAAGTEAVMEGKLVLIVDDDAGARALLAEEITLLGGQYREAASGEDALRMAASERPDIITVDLVMPGMSGRELIEKLGADSRLRRIPLIVVTASARPDGLGSMRLVTKPVNGHDLRTALLEEAGVGKVLVVDDNPDTQRLVASYAYEQGASEVRIAASGKEALQATREYRPHLVLLDLVMPDGDGFDYMSQLCREQTSNGITVIIVTSRELSLGEERELKMQTFGIFRKDEQLEENLRQALKRFVAQRRESELEAPLAGKP